MTAIRNRRSRYAKLERLSIRKTGAIIGAILVFSYILFWNISHDDTAAVSYLTDFDYAASESSERKDNKIKNKNKKIKLAVLVAGSTSRFLFDSFVTHVAKPCPDTVQIEYFAILSLNSKPAFRQDAGYMGHLAGRDTIFKDVLFSNDYPSSDTTTIQKQQQQTADDVQNLMDGVMTKALESYPAISMRGIRVLAEPIEDSPIIQAVMIREVNTEKLKLSSKNNAVITSGNGQETIDLFQQFPMMDFRDKALVRTKAGNKNIISLFLALESLYTTEFNNYEKLLKSGQAEDDNTNSNIDYVLILRDDALWLDDFDLHAIINSDPTADAYILSCDARKPKMLQPEINDHGILIKRSKSDVVGKYVTAMAHAKLGLCHKSVEPVLGKERGCNSEMILKWIIEQENQLKVKLVPQSLLPFQRSVLIHNADDGNNGRGDDYYCYHKFCQSIDDPLTIPNNIKVCKDLKF